MNFSRLLTLFAVLLVHALGLCEAANEVLTADQLVMLMKASREQYRTIQATMKATLRGPADPNGSRKLLISKEIISRWTQDRSYSKTVRTDHVPKVDDPHYSPTVINTWAITGKWSKELRERPDGKSPRGHVWSPGSQAANNELFYTPHAAMWEMCGWPWDQMQLNQTTVSWDQTSNRYIMKVKMGDSPKGPSIRLHIDPAKGYIPVLKEFGLLDDGTAAEIYECSQFRQVSGLWVPYRYSWTDTRVNRQGDYRVEELKVNEKIPEEQLDFALPKGTIVYDEIANLRYTVDDAVLGGPGLDVLEGTGAPGDGSLPIAGPESVLSPEDVEDTPPADDNELARTAEAAKELLGTGDGSAVRGRRYFYYWLAVGAVAAVVIIWLARRARSAG
ncbi:MAG: hypothetical protein ACYTEL_19255 [Planctomycetota bacterium]|jgi:hypothetical protein